MQRDPLEYVDGPNAYSYVRGRATVSVDPSGETQQTYEMAQAALYKEAKANWEADPTNWHLWEDPSDWGQRSSGKTWGIARYLCEGFPGMGWAPWHESDDFEAAALRVAAAQLRVKHLREKVIQDTLEKLEVRKAAERLRAKALAATDQDQRDEYEERAREASSVAEQLEANIKLLYLLIDSMLGPRMRSDQELILKDPYRRKDE